MPAFLLKRAAGKAVPQGPGKHFGEERENGCLPGCHGHQIKRAGPLGSNGFAFWSAPSLRSAPEAGGKLP